MAIFNVNRKKTEPEFEDDENKIQSDLSEDEKLVLDTINQAVTGGVYRDDEIVFSDLNLSVSSKFGDFNENDIVSLCKIMFVVRNPYFDDDLVETVMGIGKTHNECIINGTVEFLENVMKIVVTSLADKGGDMTINSTLLGKVRKFRMISAHETLSTGCENKNMADMWSLISGEIPKYLGTKKYYWISLFAACSNDKPNCEITINGMNYPELTQALYRYTDTWSDKKEYHMEKQFIFITQDDETFTECTFSREHVIDCTLKAIELLKQVNDNKTRDAAVNTIKAIAKDDTLSYEICTFLPEIYAQNVLGLTETDDIMLVKGEEYTTVKKSQIRSYGYIEDTVRKYLFFEKPSKEDNFKIMRLSSKMKIWSELMNDKKDPSSVIFPAPAILVDDNYVIN